MKSTYPKNDSRRQVSGGYWPYLVVVTFAIGLMVSWGCAESTALVPVEPSVSAEPEAGPETKRAEIDSGSDSADMNSDPASAKMQEESRLASQEDETESKQESDGGVIGHAGRFLESAKNKTGATAAGASKWVQQKIGGAAEVSGRTADEMWEWANQMFESLQAQGLTTAKDTSEWLSEDWKNIESWEYKVVTLEGDEESITMQLNQLGATGWECFNAEERPGGQRFYFKKRRLSYLRQLPFKDLIKLVPMMNNGE